MSYTFSNVSNGLSISFPNSGQSATYILVNEEIFCRL